MKNVLNIIVLVFCFSDLVKASGGISSEYGVCVELGSSLSFRIDYQKKELPRSWDDFEAIRIMKKGTMKHQLFRAKTINSFALVPGAPVIKPQTGIPLEYLGYSLVLISRKEGTSKFSGTGRCALLADPVGENSKHPPVYPVFFPENLAQIILKQIDGFDPNKQPLAFDDLSPFELEEKQRRESIRRPNDPLPQEETKETMHGGPESNSRPDSSSLIATKNAKDTSPTGKWFIALSAAASILAFVVWVKFKNKFRGPLR